MRRTVWVWVSGMVFCIAAPAQSRLQFSMDRGGQSAAQYTVELDEATGTGVYRPSAGVAASGGAEAAPVAIHVNAAVVKKLFAPEYTVDRQHCESHSKGVAQTGRKTLQFTHDGKTAECTYNYSDDDRLNDATVLLEAVAETMQYGDRLASKLRFDRLGLDAEVDGLTEALASGRALEVGNIAPVLKSIADDDRVMERVRRKAARLLEGAPVQTGVAADVSSR